MNTIIFNLFKKIFSFLFIFIISLSPYSIKKQNISIYNFDKTRSTKMTNRIIKYDTITKYNFKIPYGEEKIITDGQNGIELLDSNNKYITLQNKIDKIVEIGLGKDGNYTGVLTGYGPDCTSCDGRGYVSCPVMDGSNFSLVYNGAFYNDSQFGNVRVLSADQREFPCGTIIEIKNNEFSDLITGIVLDTGYSMKQAYDQGIIHIDLAFKSQNDINISTNNNTEFSVKRWGW